jgi:hypothetical protein
VETIEQEADRGVTLACELPIGRRVERALVLLDEPRIGHQSTRETVSIGARINR